MLTYYTGLKYYQDFAFMDESNPFYDEYSDFIIRNITNSYVDFDSRIDSTSIKNNISNYIESELKRLNLSTEDILILDNYTSFTALHESYQVEYGKALLELVSEGYNVHINTMSALVLCGIRIAVKELRFKYPELHKQVRVKFDNGNNIEDICITNKGRMYMKTHDGKIGESPLSDGFFDTWYDVTFKLV